MILEGILLSIFGSGVYDLVKNIVINTFNDRSDKLSSKIYDCIEAASTDFFSRYGERFGAPCDSFIAREDNVQEIIHSFKYSVKADLSEKLNKNGFAEGCIVDADALSFFIDSLFSRMHSDFELDRMLTEKKHIQDTEAKLEQMLGMLATFKPSAIKENDNGLSQWLIKDSFGNERFLRNGEHVCTKIGRCGKAEVMFIGDRQYVEITDDFGEKSYFEVDKDIKVTKSKFDIDLTKYKFLFSLDDLLEKEEAILPNRCKRIRYTFKWGNNAECIYNADGELISLSGNGSWEISKQNKTIAISNRPYGA